VRLLSSGSFGIPAVLPPEIGLVSLEIESEPIELRTSFFVVVFDGYPGVLSAFS
jgi:hypothetical protein